MPDGTSAGPSGRRRWTEAEDAALREHAGKASAREIGVLLGRSDGSVYLHAMKLGVSLRKPGAVSDYFRVIDAPMKAYVLGLLAADGWVDHEARIGIEVVTKDQSLSYAVRDELRPAGEVRFYERTDVIRGRLHHRVMARFVTRNASLAADLGRFGIVPRKTWVLQWPQALPPQFANSFICGYFDGDGHLRRKGPYWTVCSANASFLESVRGVIEQHTGIRTTRVYRQDGAWTISKYGKAVPALDAWIHRDVPGLPRKSLSTR